MPVFDVDLIQFIVAETVQYSTALQVFLRRSGIALCSYCRVWHRQPSCAHDSNESYLKLEPHAALAGMAGTGGHHLRKSADHKQNMFLCEKDTCSSARACQNRPGEIFTAP